MQSPDAREYTTIANRWKTAILCTVQMRYTNTFSNFILYEYTISIKPTQTLVFYYHYVCVCVLYSIMDAGSVAFWLNENCFADNQNRVVNINNGYYQTLAIYNINQKRNSGNIILLLQYLK